MDAAIPTPWNGHRRPTECVVEDATSRIIARLLQTQGRMQTSNVVLPGKLCILGLGKKPSSKVILMEKEKKFCLAFLFLLSMNFQSKVQYF